MAYKDPFPTVIRPAERHLAQYSTAAGTWSAEHVARAQALLQDIRVLGDDPVQPTLAALAEHLAAQGIPLESYDRPGQMEQIVSLTGWGGPLAEFLAVPGLANIQINGDGRNVILEYASGHRDVVPRSPISREWVELMVRCWLAQRGVFFGPEARLPGIVHGSTRRMRFTYLGPEHATSGMTLQLRLPLPHPTLEELVDRGLMTPEAAQWLRAFVKVRANILVAGGTNAGKTTLVNALLAEIDPLERLAVIEMFAELDVAGREGTVAYEVGWDADEAALGKLLHANLYNSVQRLVLGEARGGETAQLIMAMASGVDGCIATIHAESADDAVRRLAQSARMHSAMAGLPVGELARMIASLHLVVVHLELSPSGDGVRRRASQMIEVYDATEQGVFKRHEIFRLDAQGALEWAEPGLSDRLMARFRRQKQTLPPKQNHRKQ
jgi:pilus assembly protein CpaF